MPKPRVLSGLDVLVAEDFRRLKGKRVALLVHEPSISREYIHAIDLFASRSDLTLARIFAPEHGLYGAAQDMIPLARRDKRAMHEVVTLYGEREEDLWPEVGQLADIDVLVADLQDIGSRYYTYAATLSFCMQRARAAGCRVMVLDRPNPLGGLVREGLRLDETRWRSFVGYWPLLVRHGFTIGELASYLNTEMGIGCELEIVRMQGYSRAFHADELDIPWVMPSPNMPTPDVARVYPGACLIEGTNLSEGRGTTRPFELVGAPFFPAREIARRLHAEAHPGVALRVTSFRPTFHKFAGQSCEGLQIHATRPHAMRSWLLFVRLLTHLHALDCGLSWRTETYEYVNDRLAIDLLLGDARLRPLIEGHAPLADFAELEAQALAAGADSHRAATLYD